MRTTAKVVAALALAVTGYLSGAAIASSTPDVTQHSTQELFTELEDRGVVHD